MKKGSPDLKVAFYYTDDVNVEKYGHAISNINRDNCRVVLNNRFATMDEMRVLKKYTGWDDEQMAIMLVAHELQHCVTTADIRQAVFNKEALSERTAQALHTYVWGTGVGKKVARDPESAEAVAHLMATAKDDVFGRANESISDITALLLVQKLSKQGLTIEAVEGFKKWRTEFHPDEHVDRHHTVPALDMYVRMMKIHQLLGTDLEPEKIAEAAYTIVGETKPDNEYTNVTVEDLKKARGEYLNDSAKRDSFGM